MGGWEKLGGRLPYSPETMGGVRLFCWHMIRSAITSLVDAHDGRKFTGADKKRTALAARHDTDWIFGGIRSRFDFETCCRACGFYPDNIRRWVRCLWDE